MEAVSSGDLANCESLIKAGVNVNAKSKEGYAALHLAVNFDHLEIVKLLLEHGADVTIRSDDGDAPIDLASSEKMRALLKEDAAK